MQAIIIHGPRGSGKTTHAMALAAFYRKATVIEADLQFNDWANAECQFPADALVITADTELARRPGAIHIKDACAEAGLPVHPSLLTEDATISRERQALITLGKYAAGYRPGDDEWTAIDQEALDLAMHIRQSA